MCIQVFSSKEPLRPPIETEGIVIIFCITGVMSLTLLYNVIARRSRFLSGRRSLRPTISLVARNDGELKVIAGTVH
jgi:hypothetical protein